jgi:hypothetical protein
MNTERGEASGRDLLKEMARHLPRKIEESTKKLSQYNRCLGRRSMKNEDGNREGDKA